MQVISIAVSAILIVAGLVAAPGLINSSRDTNAKGDIKNIAKGIELYQSNTGEYPTQMSQLMDTAVTGIKLTLSDGVNAQILPNGGDTQTWCAAVKSRSGAWFSHTSQSAKILKGESLSAALSGSGCAAVDPDISKWSEWRLVGGAYIDGDELVLPSVGAIAYAPKVWCEPYKSATFNFDVNTPSGGKYYAIANYYSDTEGVTPPNNGVGWRWPGVAGVVPAGWQRTSTVPTQIEGVSGCLFMLAVSSSYGEPGTRYRAPSITFTD